MKNILLGILLLGCVAQAQAQERFFKLIDGWKNEKIVETDSSYLSIGLSTTSSYHNYYRFNEIDKQGNLMSSKSFDIDTFSELNIYTSHDILECNNGWLIMGAGYLPVNTKGTALFFNSKLDDTLISRQFLYETGAIMRCPVSANGTFACLAECYKANGDMYIKFIKLDSSLHELSFRNYNPPYTSLKDWFTPNQLLSTIDGGYMIVGLEQVISNGLYAQRPVLIKTNSQCIQQWRRYVGDANYLCEGGYAVPSPDGGWLVAWSAPSIAGNWSNVNYHDGITIEKIASNGTTEWIKDLGWFMDYQTDNSIYYPKQFQALSDGNYLVSGYANKRGILLKVTSNGDPIWYRPISDPFAADNAGIFTEVQINSATPTSDGGFICAGEYRSDGGGLFPNFVQSAFAMKLDEYGCLEPGCQVVDAVEEVEAAQVPDFLVYPNPSTGYLNLIGNFETAEVYDLTGRLLLQTKESHLNIESLAKGMYLVLFKQANQVIYAQKVLRQ